MRNASIRIGVSMIALALGSAAIAADEEEMAKAENEEWVSLTGSVSEVTGSTFTLDYGGGDILVEMDDFDDYSDNWVAKGDSVTVNGDLDDDFYETRKIEASSVYVDNLNTYYYASSADEEGGYHSYAVSDYQSNDEWIGVTGRVTEVRGEEMLLDTGPSLLTVDTSDMKFEPSVDDGDRVSVYGDSDDADLFDAKEIRATAIVILKDA